MHPAFHKRLQLTIISLFQSKLFIALLILLIFLTLNSILHVIDTFLDLSITNSATFFNQDKNSQFLIQYRDNIAEKDVKDLLCYEPMDIVYTWVNGSDPYHQFIKEFFSEEDYENRYETLERLKLPTHKEFWNWYQSLGLGSGIKSGIGSVLGFSKTENIGSGTGVDDGIDGIGGIDGVNGISLNDLTPSDWKYLWKSDVKSTRDLNNALEFLSLSHKNTTIDQDNGSNRFRDNDELRYSMRSLEKFAPWVRNIYLITSGQVPSWLDTSNPRIHVILSLIHI